MVSLGVSKQKLKKHHKKGLVLRVVDFLCSDSYMFAPLVSSQPSISFPTSTSGVETNKPLEERNEKLPKKVGEYMKSDCFMYAPLFAPQRSLHPDANTVIPLSGTVTSEPVCRRQIAATAVSIGKITEKIDQATKHTVQVIEQDQSPMPRITRSTVVQRTLTHQEIVKKQMVHQKGRSSIQGKFAA